MSKPAASTQARKAARERRIALQAERAAQDQRIEDHTAKAIDQIARHTTAAAHADTLAATVGETLTALLAEGLRPEDVATLTGLDATALKSYLTSHQRGQAARSQGHRHGAGVQPNDHRRTAETSAHA